MNRNMFTRGLVAVVVAAALLTSTAWQHAVYAAPAGGVVYVLTNTTDANAVAVFTRASDGTLTAAGTVATGGTGTGKGLGSQGALVLSANHHWLFAVNAGSNEVSVFDARDTLPKLVSRTPSGGKLPISLTVHDDWMYVLNAGGSGMISGFHVDGKGHLTPLKDGTHPLSSSAANPAQIAFSPDGKLLAVTEKGTNRITTYRIGGHGSARGPMQHASAGNTPFGFAFSPRGDLIVSEAFGGAAGAGAVSSYATNARGNLRVMSASVPDQQSAPCWTVVTRDGRYAYTANAGSDSVSGYRIDHDGQLHLLTDAGITGALAKGSHPVDMDLSWDSQYLYTLNTGDGTISVFQTQDNGQLTSRAGATGLPTSAQGIAAR